MRIAMNEFKVKPVNFECGGGGGGSTWDGEEPECAGVSSSREFGDASCLVF